MNKYLLGAAVAALAAMVALPALAKPAAHQHMNPHAALYGTATSTPGNAPGVRMGAGHTGKPMMHLRTVQGSVTSVASTTFMLKVRATEYTVNPTASARIINRTWHKIALSDISVGDKVRVFGSASSTTISARIIRDITLPRMGTTTPAMPTTVSTSTGTTTGT